MTELTRKVSTSEIMSAKNFLLESDDHADVQRVSAPTTVLLREYMYASVTDNVDISNSAILHPFTCLDCYSVADVHLRDHRETLR